MFRRIVLQPLFPGAAAFFAVCCAAAAQELPPAAPPSGGDFSQAPVNALPAGKILVRGAEPSASDRSTPLPEEGAVVRDIYQNRYLRLSIPLPNGWAEAFKGPPPSENGVYVLANVLPSNVATSPEKGTLMLSAQDMFFATTPAANATELVEYARAHLPSYYEVERRPDSVTIAGHRFARFAYQSPVAQIHWVVLATEIRCHALQFVLASRDSAVLEKVVRGLDGMTLPAEADAESGRGGGDVPLCIRDYASGPNLINKVDPVLSDHRLGAIPVRLIIDRRGRVKHVHVLRAFPEQAAKITAALLQWRFKEYVRNGETVEVETGIVFGSQLHAIRQAAKTQEGGRPAD